MKNLAIAGLGGWGRRLVQSVQGTSDKVRFTQAAVTRPERSREFADKHGLKLHASIEDMLAEGGFDGFVSAGPAHLHAAHSLTALKAGKHVLAIKPMALNAKEAKALAAAAGKGGLQLCMGFDRCFYPNVAELRRRLKEGALGQILHTEGDFCVHRYGGIKAGTWKADPKFAPPGGLVDHMLYLTVETLGRIEKVHAIGLNQASDNELADTTGILLKGADNTSGLLTAIGMTPDYFRFTVFGTEGWCEIRDKRELTFQPKGGERETLSLPDADALRDEVETFADAMAGAGAFPVTVEQAVHGVAVLEAMAKSANGDGRATKVS